MRDILDKLDEYSIRKKGDTSKIDQDIEKAIYKLKRYKERFTPDKIAYELDRLIDQHAGWFEDVNDDYVKNKFYGSLAIALGLNAYTAPDGTTISAELDKKGNYKEFDHGDLASASKQNKLGFLDQKIAKKYNLKWNDKFKEIEPEKEPEKDDTSSAPDYKRNDKQDYFSGTAKVTSKKDKKSPNWYDELDPSSKKGKIPVAKISWNGKKVEVPTADNYKDWLKRGQKILDKIFIKYLESRKKTESQQSLKNLFYLLEAEGEEQENLQKLWDKYWFTMSKYAKTLPKEAQDEFMRQIDAKEKFERKVKVAGIKSGPYDDNRDFSRDKIDTERRKEYGAFTEIIQNFKGNPTLDNLRNAIEQAKDVSIDYKFYTDSSKLNQFYGMLAKALGGIRGLIHLEPGTFQNRQVSFAATQKNKKSKDNPELMPQGQHVTQDFDPNKHRDIAQLQYDGGLLPDDFANELGLEKTDDLDPNPPSAELKEPPEEKYKYDKEPSRPLRKGVPGHPFNKNMKLRRPGGEKPLAIPPNYPGADAPEDDPGAEPKADQSIQGQMKITVSADKRYIIVPTSDKSPIAKKINLATWGSGRSTIDRQVKDGKIYVKTFTKNDEDQVQVATSGKVKIIDKRGNPGLYDETISWMKSVGYPPIAPGQAVTPPAEKPAQTPAAEPIQTSIKQQKHPFTGKTSFVIMKTDPKTGKQKRASQEEFPSQEKAKAFLQNWQLGPTGWQRKAGAKMQIQRSSVDNSNKEDKMLKEASMNISMTGNNSHEVQELMAILKNAGMDTAHLVTDTDINQPMGMEEPHMCPACAAAHSMNSPCGEAVEEEYVNSPDEEYQDDSYMIQDLSGGLNRKKERAAQRVKDPAVAYESKLKNHLRGQLQEMYQQLAETDPFAELDRAIASDDTESDLERQERLARLKMMQKQRSKADAAHDELSKKMKEASPNSLMKQMKQRTGTGMGGKQHSQYKQFANKQPMKIGPAQAPGAKGISGAMAQGPKTAAAPKTASAPKTSAAPKATLSPDTHAMLKSVFPKHYAPERAKAMYDMLQQKTGDAMSWLRKKTGKL